MENIKLLYVDDEVDALTSMKIGLESRGYDVAVADSGSAAIEILKSNKPQVIIADLRMQPMNGFELFQQVRKNKNTKKIPFFFLTAVDDFLAQKYGSTLGVDAYITKPIDLDHLDSFIRQKLKI